MKIRPTHHVSVGGVIPPKGKHEKSLTGVLAALKIFTAGVQSLKGHVTREKATKKDKQLHQSTLATTQKIPSPYLPHSSR